MVEVLTSTVEQIATVKTFMNLRGIYESIYIVPHRNSFQAYPLLKVSQWMVQWYPKFPYDGGWVSKNRLIYRRIFVICVFWKYFCFFCFWSICRLFYLSFTKNIHENSVGKTFLGCSFICIVYISDNTKSDSFFSVPWLIKKFPARINLYCLQQIPLN